MDKSALLPQPVAGDTVDLGRIKVGSCGRLPAASPAEVADTGRIKVGSCGRLPADRAVA